MNSLEYRLSAHKVSFIPNGIELPESQNREGKGSPQCLPGCGAGPQTAAALSSALPAADMGKRVDVLLQAAGLAVEEPSLL